MCFTCKRDFKNQLALTGSFRRDARPPSRRWEKHRRRGATCRSLRREPWERAENHTRKSQVDNSLSP